MRLNLFAAVSSAALLAVAGQASAQDAMTAPTQPPAMQETPAPAEAPAPVATTGTFTDAQLTSFNDAMTKVKVVADAVQGGTPTAEQQAEMAAAVEGSGLGVEQFNAISAAVSTDTVLQARLAVINAPAPTPGSVAAGVTDAEIEQFSATMVKMREIAPADGATPTPEQQAEMAATVQASGLEVDRFNAIATAVSQDEGLRARVQLADAERSETGMGAGA